MRKLNLLVVCAVVVGFAGCGGDRESQRVRSVGESVIADVPLSERTALFEAQHRIDVAQAALQKARSTVAKYERDLQVANVEEKQAALEVEKRSADAELAERQRDVNAVRATLQELGAARMGLAAADAREAYMAQRHRAALGAVEVAKGHLAVANAEYEREKASLASSLGRTPTSDFSLAAFDRQVADARTELEDAQQNFDQLREGVRTWKAKYEDVAARAQRATDRIDAEMGERR